jgi:exonuclease III
MWNMGVLTQEQSERLCTAVVSRAADDRLQLIGLCEVGHQFPEFPGFTCVPAEADPNRSVRGAGRGKGLGWFVHDAYARYTTTVKSTRHYVWLRVALPLRVPVFVCAVYLPPAGSKVAWSADITWEDTLNELQADVAAYSRLGEVCMLGDFNAHTDNLEDRGTACDSLLDDMGSMGGVVDSRLIAIPVRTNSDRTPACAVGKRLVELCVATGCVFLNGRAPGDQEGRSTFEGGEGPSVIDYGIVSRSLFPHVPTFAVEDNFGLSDHNPLVTVLCVPTRPAPAPVAHPAPAAVRWDPDKRDVYRQLLAGDTYSQ